MTNHHDQPKFESWAVVELFGHNQIAGHVSEVSLGGTGFIRVDVPQLDDQPEYTKLFHGNAIYAITPTTEEVACQVARRINRRPIQEWRPGTPQLPARTIEAADDDDDDDGDGLSDGGRDYRDHWIR